ncbi:hypothetical protein [Angustibacter luteus]|uniref:Uncharacterized protein n=1 Tax=Angustibacter luteus TaxID=658456 RepID=A0ABW1JFM2_9ACTN
MTQTGARLALVVGVGLALLAVLAFGWATGLAAVGGVAVGLAALALAIGWQVPNDPDDGLAQRVLRGAIIGFGVAVLANGTLELVDRLQYGADEEWLTSFLFWDVPSTLLCAGVGAVVPVVRSAARRA